MPLLQQEGGEATIFYCSVGLVLAAVLAAAYWLKQPRLSAKLGDITYHLLSRPDHKAALAALNRINSDLLCLAAYLKAKYRLTGLDADSPSGGAAANWGRETTAANRREIAAAILRNFNPEVLYENEPSGRDGTSYTLEKGNKLVMCLRDKATGKIHDHHTLMFVALHELAHMGNGTYGHGVDFWRTFKVVLTEARAAGIHDPVNYALRPIVYCGLRVDYNPYFDPAL